MKVLPLGKECEMKKGYFNPWQGANYAKHRTVIMSESTYDWQVNGKWRKPTPDHPALCVRQVIEEWDSARYFIQLTRAICQGEWPTDEQIETGWNNLGYTVFVQESIGRGPRTRPTSTQWKHASKLFPQQLEKFDPKPRKLVVTGMSIWNYMPFDESVQLAPGLRAFEFDSELLWCLALPHPSNRQKDGGFSWREVGRVIQAFLATSFPKRLK
jgi:hypothetical protein